MHICLVTSGRPSELPIGGEERFTLSFGYWLACHGDAVTVVGRRLFGAEVMKIEKSDNPPLKLMHPGAHGVSTNPATLNLPYFIYAVGMLLTSMLFVLRIIAVNRRSRLSIIHAQDTGYGGLSAILSARILRLPVIISSHGVRYVTLSKTLNGISQKFLLAFEHWLDIITTKSADLVIVVSTSTMGHFAALGITKRKLKLIPIGVEISKFTVCNRVRETLRKELDVQNNFVIGFVGRFSVEKNLFTLLEAFAQASKHHDEMKLILVGTGQMAEELKGIARNRGLNNRILFTGIRYDVYRLLPAFDLFILPSYTEGCPTALIEAMSSGKAIIASAIPSIIEIVGDSEDAILVNPYDAEELKRAILLLYNNPSLRTKLGRRAKEGAKLYDIDKVYRRISKVYEEIVRCRAKQYVAKESRN